MKREKRPSIPGQGRRPLNKSSIETLSIHRNIPFDREFYKVKGLIAVVCIYSATLLQFIANTFNLFKLKVISRSSPMLQACDKTATHVGGGRCYVY